MTVAGVVEDHPLFGQAIKELIESIPNVTVAGLWESAEDCIQALRQHKIKLLILDLQLKSSSGLELLKLVHQSYPEIRVLVISMHPEETWGERVLRAGSKGYVSKADTPRAIRQAIVDVLSGKLAYSEDLKELMLSDLCRLGNKGEDRIALLTDRELEVFYQLGSGETTRGIAHKLHLSIKTVETYRERIKQKLNLSNSNQLMQQATIWVHSCNGLPDKN